MGYSKIVSSFPEELDTPGYMEIAFQSECDTYPYEGFWRSLNSTNSVGITEYDTCMKGKYVTCNDGVVSLEIYGSNDCSGDVQDTVEANIPTECYLTRDDDETTGSDDYRSDQKYETGYCTAGADGYTFTPIDNDNDSKKKKSLFCFAGSEMVTYESGLSKPIADVVVGDRVLAANAQGAFIFSDVIAVPHAKNNERVIFNEIILANGADIHMTGEHLLPVASSCGKDAVFTVTAAKNVATDSCIMTVDGPSAVVSNREVVGTGVFTIVTKEEFVVVNGCISCDW